MQSNESSATTIANSVPTVTGVDLTPDLPTANDTLACQMLGFDDGDAGDPDLSEYRWFVDGVLTYEGMQSLTATRDNLRGAEQSIRPEPG